MANTDTNNKPVKKPETRKAPIKKTSSSESKPGANKPGQNKKPVKKSGPKNSAKPGAKKPAGKKPAKGKKPVSNEKQIPAGLKNNTRSKDIPVGLRNSTKNGNVNLDNSIVTNKNKRKKKKKKKRANAEKIFWIIVALAVIGAGSFAAFYIFQDYNNDNSTPAQLNVPKISAEDSEYIGTLATEHEIVEKVEVKEQGPVIYVIYTTPAGTPKEDIMRVISESYAAAREEKPELFELYSFQITVVNSGDEAEGVNDYPLIGSLNAGRGGVSWMATDGNFEEPVTETEEEKPEGTE